MGTDARGIAEHADTVRDAQEIVSTPPVDLKPLDLPARGATPRTHDLESLESYSDKSRGHIRVQSVEIAPNIPERMLGTPNLPVRGADLAK